MNRRAYTLIEVLVSMAVLLLMIGLMAQLFDSASSTALLHSGWIASDSQARMVFERMSLDFSKMIRRRDVDCLFIKRSGSGAAGRSDRMFFFSEAPAYFAPGTADSDRNSAALVGYRVTDGDDPPTPRAIPCVLERLGKGLAWDGMPGAGPGGMPFLPLAAPVQSGGEGTIDGAWPETTGAAPTYSGADECFHVLGDRVIRMEICFQVLNLENPRAPGAAYSNYPVAKFGASPANATTIGSSIPTVSAPGDRRFDPACSRACLSTGGTSWIVHGISDVCSIIVTLAVLDPGSRAILPDPVALAGALPDCSDADLDAIPPRLPSGIWKTRIEEAIGNGAEKGIPGVPLAVLSRIRIYQRSFQLKSEPIGRALLP